MGSNNKSYRIRTTVGKETDTFIDVHLDQDYDSLEILSLKLSDKDTYKLHNSDYGVVVGRVLANGNFGVPNAKISVFIEADEQNSSLEMWSLYPYTSTSTKNDKNVRYNLLPDKSVKDCHKAVGSFPNKTFLLENDATLEVFDKYYVYTTRTNAAGDYLICGVPTGMQTIHMDLDLSDCGILSQRPRDFVYKGYTIEQFENPNQFKSDENIDGLSQIFSQNQPVYVQPFWGNSDNGENIGITRADINISFKFEPTCVFMGSAISDNASNGVGKKCIPTNQMGAMDELTAGEGTIEMIRKTPGGNVEEFSIKGNQVINGNGVWCYQIPMNLDYMMTDEYGNMVPTDDPEKGIPTRTRVRFRASLTDMENSSQSFYRAKYLIPNNPGIDEDKVDYNFGTYTDESSYRDLFWNGVYTVKSYIPRFQKSKRWKNERFSGIKACNYYGGNNPMPYNNMRIKIPFMFSVLCIFVKAFIKIVTIVNRILTIVWRAFLLLPFDARGSAKNNGAHCIYIGDGLCPDMEGWYFAPACMEGNFKLRANAWRELKNIIFNNTLHATQGSGDIPGSESKDTINSGQYTDETSIDTQNRTSNEEETVCLTRNVDYLVNCFEMNLAQEYRVIKFDFYNDWINGVIYFPRWMRKIKRKKRYRFSLSNGISTYYKDKVQGCMNSENSTVKKSRYYTQQCSLSYTGVTNQPWTKVLTPISCNNKDKSTTSPGKPKVPIFPARCHKKKGMSQSSIFGKKSGLVSEQTTMLGEYVYYLKPCEWKDTDNGKKRTLLFATDIVLLGTLNDCDENGLPQSFKYLNGTSYIMPTNLALTTMDDDSYIYSESGGTICLSSSDRPPANFKEENFKDTVKRITPNYKSTSEAYHKTEDDKLTYDENDDPIPVTEAAGITWNYSGPGQDDVNSDKMESPTELINRMFGNSNRRYSFIYYPGGHFLGLSCVNSESNIKSCVNLKRICEMGATMSQRREELRGYDQITGKPKYRYYVPTGLISNVDIEGASFRSMFATLNHNKLIAEKENETTGYKYYDFRYLYPDGFDGSLLAYVHKSDSPYNRKVNHGSGESRITAVADNTEWFKQMFPTWSQPDDYDPEESKFTETRTIEDTVNDYYMFRFGLNNFSTKEQKKHYLLKSSNGYSLPQYENSFYFYFGLKDGSTALDEFKKQFFSECESNNVMKAPSLSVVEKIDENLNGTATLVIDNMLSPYSVTLTDNTIGSDPQTIQATEDDTVDLELFAASGINIVIGHEYTAKVTDSIGQSETKTFVFGSNAVIAEIDTVHFRYNRRSVGTSKTGFKYGGYLKIGNTITILGEQHNLSDVNLKYRLNGGAMRELQEESSYVDGGNELQHLFKMENVGNYEIYANYNGNDVIIYTTVFEDNSDVEVYVACDYLGYKTGIGLSAITENNWFNTPDEFGQTTIDSWLLRHSFYRQTENDDESFDSNIYTKTKGGTVAIFGWPEKDGLVDGTVLADTYYKDDYDSYIGYSLDESSSFIPTMYWDTERHIMDQNAIGRNPFDVMVYTDDGRAAADATDITVTGFNGFNGNLLITATANTVPIGISEGHGCVMVLENDTILFPVVTEITGNEINMICYNTENPYENINENALLSNLLDKVSVYPTLRVPVIYKPFYSSISAATWNNVGLTLEMNEDGETVLKRVTLPVSYKVEGVIHNGLTWNGHFYSGETAGQGEEQIYETYLIDNTNSSFYNALTANTSDDYRYDRSLSFGTNSLNDGFTNEITAYTETEETIDSISYAITEGFPDIIKSDPLHDKVFSGKYENGFDLTLLEGTCDFSDAFPTNLRVYGLTISGAVSACCLIADSIPDESTTELYAIKNAELFIDNGVYLTSQEGAWSFLLPRYAHGTFNVNAKYDVKGKTQALQKIGNDYYGQVTKSNGTQGRVRSSNEEKIYQSGITMLHNFTLNPIYKKNVSEIENILLNATAVTATTLVNGSPNGESVNIGEQPTDTGSTHYTCFNRGIANYFSRIDNSDNYTTIVAKYTMPETGSKNKMIVYKLYSVKSLEVMYPPNSGDINEE